MKAVVIAKTDVIITPVKAEIVKMCADGLAARDIGKKLKISPRTVEGHIASMKKSLGCKSITQLVAYFLRVGLIK